MATFTQLNSGSWRVQVRRKGRYISETFLHREDAKKWAAEAERRIDVGATPQPSKIARMKTFGEFIDLHVADMCEVGKAPRRTKAATLEMLKRRIGHQKLSNLDRHLIIEFGRSRATEGAGPVTLSADIGAIKLVLSHAAAVHGLQVSTEAVDLARIALKRLGLIGKSVERDRRPTEDELLKLFANFNANQRLTIPMTRIVQFAIASAMRQEEIFKATWDDFNTRTKMLTIRDRKDPRAKLGNHQRIPLLNISGFDPIELIEAQRAQRKNSNPRIFPYNHRSAGTAFRRACFNCKIEDLHFHDLRHEGTSRLFEAGFQIQQVSLVTGHRDWKMLRRYTHIRPEALHDMAAAHAV